MSSMHKKLDAERLDALAKDPAERPGVTTTDPQPLDPGSPALIAAALKDTWEQFRAKMIAAGWTPPGQAKAKPVTPASGWIETTDGQRACEHIGVLWISGGGRCQECGAIYTAQAQGEPVVDDDLIRRVFMANGFTIKPGQDDLKPYVFAAALALLAAAPQPAQPERQPLDHHPQLRDRGRSHGRLPGPAAAGEAWGPQEGRAC